MWLINRWRWNGQVQLAYMTGEEVMMSKTQYGVEYHDDENGSKWQEGVRWCREPTWLTFRSFRPPLIPVTLLPTAEG